MASKTGLPHPRKCLEEIQGVPLAHAPPPVVHALSGEQYSMHRQHGFRRRPAKQSTSLALRSGIAEQASLRQRNGGGPCKRPSQKRDVKDTPKTLSSSLGIVSARLVACPSLQDVCRLSRRRAHGIVIQDDPCTCRHLESDYGGRFLSQSHEVTTLA